MIQFTISGKKFIEQLKAERTINNILFEENKIIFHLKGNSLLEISSRQVAFRSPGTELQFTQKIILPTDTGFPKKKVRKNVRKKNLKKKLIDNAAHKESLRA